MLVCFQNMQHVEGAKEGHWMKWLLRYVTLWSLKLCQWLPPDERAEVVNPPPVEHISEKMLSARAFLSDDMYIYMYTDRGVGATWGLTWIESMPKHQKRLPTSAVG